MRASSLLLATLALAFPTTLVAQDFMADPTYGNVSLDAGFLPDPHEVSVMAGGKIEVDVGSCSFGYVSDAPDVDFYYTTSGSANLHIYAEGDGDTMLLINTPSGEWLCNDDGYAGLDPLVSITGADDGLYNIWVGSFSPAAIEATLYISELNPGNGSDVSLPDFTLEPAFGTISLEQGFLPDPHEVDLVAGGSIDVNSGSCTYGYVADAPDYDLFYETNGSGTLYIYVESKDDTTLLVNTPSGEWICNDDGFEGTNPILVIPNAQDGLYDIWVGSYSGERNAAAKLYISELDPR